MCRGVDVREAVVDEHGGSPVMLDTYGFGTAAGMAEESKQGQSRGRARVRVPACELDWGLGVTNPHHDGRETGEETRAEQRRRAAAMEVAGTGRSSGWRRRRRPRA